MAALALGAGLAGQEGLRQRPAVLQAAEADSAERELRTTPVVRAVQRAADSVVSIYLQTPQARGRRPITQGQGSGVILDETGLCITNWHVVAAALQADDRTLPIGIEVKLRDGRSRTAVVLSSSATHDLALLQMRLEADEKVKPIEIAHSAELMIGETLLAIGNPQGHANTVTVGVLSATGREIAVRSPDGQLREYKQLLQTDAAINQGNSGGALLDITGRLVGINNAMAVGAENIGFAIPIDLVREVFTKELVQSENFAVAADSPWLGIEVTDQGGQVVVAAVQAGSPAAKAGVERGDVLLRIDDQPLRSGLDYQRRLIDARLQRPLPLQLRRGTRELQIEAVPTTATHSLLLSLVGAEFEEIDTTRAEPVLRRATRAFYGTRGRPGEPMLPSTLRLAAVQAGSPAEALGLQPGDVVFAVTLVAGFREREHPILSARDLLQVLQQFQGRAVRISVLRGDEELTGLLEVRTPRRR
jgi:serine protease Do